MARLRVAVAGAGYFSRFHYDGWSRIPEAEIVGICDPDTAKAEAAAASFPGAAVFTEAAAMLDALRPDLFDIVTPPASHAALVAAGAARRIPMLCQKPLADTLAEAEAIVSLARRAGVLLVAHENFRFMPWYREARRLIDAGALGTPLNVTFRLRPGDGQGPRAYLDRQPYFQQMERLLIHETAIHLIDVFRFLMGEVTGVFARLKRFNPVIKGEDAGILVFDFAGGATGLFDGNRLIDHPATDPRLTMGALFLEGTAATLRLDGEARLWLKPRGAAEAEHAYAWRREGYGGDCVRAVQAHVVAHLMQAGALENEAGAYLRNIAIEEALYRSHDEGRWIGIPDAA